MFSFKPEYLANVPKSSNNVLCHFDFNSEKSRDQKKKMLGVT